MKIRILKEQVRQIIKEELALLTEGDNFDPAKIQQDIDSAGEGHKLSIYAVPDSSMNPLASFDIGEVGLPRHVIIYGFGEQATWFPTMGLAQGAASQLNQAQGNHTYVAKA